MVLTNDTGRGRAILDRHERVAPQLGFARQTMLTEGGLNFVQSGLDDNMPGGAWQIWSDGSRECPACPGPPAALLPPRLVHPIRVVLEVDPRIAEEYSVRRTRDQPRHRPVRQRMLTQHRLISTQFGAKRAIQTQQRTRREPTQPERMAVLETREVELAIPRGTAKRVQRAPVESFARRRQVRAWRKTFHHPPVAAGDHATRQSAARARWFRLAPRLDFTTTTGLNEPVATPQLAPPPGVHQISGWRRVALWPLGALVRLWGRTLRFEETTEDVRNYTKKNEPVVIVLWHNRLFLAAEIVRRYRCGRTPYALVSASQDGAWLTAFFSLAGLRTVRGSSSRLGREAATALVEVLRAGYDVGITPDGPRGPCYEVKPGTVIVSRRTRAPMLLVGAEFASAWRLGSWDRFYVPKPFSRVRMRCEVISPEQLADREEGTALLQRRLLALNHDAASD